VGREGERCDGEGDAWEGLPGHCSLFSALVEESKESRGMFRERAAGSGTGS
jgi:hypothetical protein